MKVLGQGPEWPNVAVVELKVLEFIVQSVESGYTSWPRNVQKENLSDDLLKEGNGPLAWGQHHGEAQQVVEGPGKTGAIKWLLTQPKESLFLNSIEGSPRSKEGEEGLIV
jgi:hypothetical protein